MLANQFKECIWDSQNNAETWELMSLSASDNTKQWISMENDEETETNHIDILACLSPGCKNISCPLVPEKLIAVLVNNKIDNQDKSIGVGVRLELIDTIPELLFENNKRYIDRTFLFGPRVKSKYFPNNNGKIHSELLGFLNEIPSKCVNISIDLIIVRDTSSSLKDFNYCKSNNWDSIDGSSKAKMRLYSNLR